MYSWQKWYLGNKKDNVSEISAVIRLVFTWQIGEQAYDLTHTTNTFI